MNAERNLSDIDLAELYDVEDRTIRNWVSRGCPCSGKGSKRRYDGEEVAGWLKASGLTGANGRPREQYDPSDPLMAAKLRKENALAELNEIKVAERRKELVSRVEVEQANVAKFTTIRNKLLGLPASVSPLSEGKSSPEIEQLMEERITEILQELSRT